MEKLIITGSTGFIGRYVVNYALDKGYDVHSIVRNPAKTKALFGDKIKVHSLDDFTNIERLRKIIDIVKPEYVIHLIGIIQEIKNNNITFEKVHYEYSKCLYESLKEFPIKKVIHMSALGVDEHAPSKYHITKLKAEQKLIKSGIPYVIIRPSFILGPEQLLFVKLKSFLKKFSFLIFPNIKGYYFQPVDVRDVAECFIKGIEYKGEGIFELCGDKKVSLKEIVRDFIKQNGKQVLFIPIPKIALKVFAVEQYKMMWRNNVCGYSKETLPIWEILGRQPISYKESIRWSANPYQ